MNNPWSTSGVLAPVRPARAHDELRRRARAPRARQALRTGRATRCSPSRTMVPQRPAFDGRRSGAAECRAELPAAGRSRRPRAGVRDRRRARRARGRAPRPRGHGGMDHGERRRRLPRPPVLDRSHARRRSSCRRPSPGSRSTTPAASSRSAGGCRPCIGTSCSTPGRMCFALATDDSHHPGFDSDRAWTWVRAEQDRRGRARGPPDRLLLRHDRAPDPRRGRGRRLGRGALRPVPERHRRVRRLERRSGPRGPARLPLRRRDPRGDCRRLDHRRPARPARRRRRTRASR